MRWSSSVLLLPSWPRRMTVLPVTFESSSKLITKSLWEIVADGKVILIRPPKKLKIILLQSKEFCKIVCNRMSRILQRSRWSLKRRWSHSWWSDRIWRIRSRSGFSDKVLATKSWVKAKSWDLKRTCHPQPRDNKTTKKHSTHISRTLKSQKSSNPILAKKTRSSKLTGIASHALEIWTKQFTSWSWHA